MTDPRIIIFNGIGSVGKSSTAKALQKIASEHFLHVPGDAFLEMLPDAMMDHPDGIVFKTLQTSNGPSVAIEMGPAMDRLMRGFRRSVAALAHEGNSLLVDDVMLYETDQHYYREVLGEFDVRFVGFFAPLDMLEQRERDRKDRLVGLARWQYGRVHKGIAYDLEIDTSETSPDECARKIAQAFSL